MKFWKTSVSALFATVIFASEALLVVQTAVAQPSSTIAPSSLKTTIRPLAELKINPEQRKF